MIRSALLVVILLGAGACQIQKADSEPPPKPVIAGGYAPASETDPNQKAARELAIAEIYKKYPSRALVEKVTAEVQVVAGLNYSFHIEMSGAAAYTVVVYRDLQGHMSVTRIDQVAK